MGKDKILPNGVFAVNVLLPTGVERRGLLNVGIRPTFRAARPQRSVEVHLLDFSGDLTGRRLRLRFLKKLRNEKKFLSDESLGPPNRQRRISRATNHSPPNKIRVSGVY